MGRKPVLAALGLYLCVHSAFAQNPAHEAAVEFAFPLLKSFAGPSLLLEESYTHDASQRLRIPASYLHPVNRDWRLGLGVKTRWFEEPNNVRHLLAGVEYAWSRDLTLQADGLLGVANYAGDALSVGAKHRLELDESFLVRTRLRLGFLDAIVWHPDYAVLSGSVMPEWRAGESVSLEVEAYAATQLPGMVDFFSLDIAPSFTLRFDRTWGIRFGAIFGLMGSDPSPPRFRMVQQFHL